MIKNILKFFITATFLVSFFSPSRMDTVHAAEHNDVITKISIVNKDGSPITGPIRQWERFRIDIDFALPNNTVKAGDTSTFTFPNELALSQNPAFELRDPRGNLVATAVMNQRTVTLTYTDYPERHSDVTGTLHIFARVDHVVIPNAQTIQVDFTIEGKVIPGGKIDFNGIGKPYPNEIDKAGWQSSTDSKIIEYAISINRKKVALNNAVVKDTLKIPGASFNQSSLRIYQGDWQFINGDWRLLNQRDVTADYAVTWNGQEFSVNLGNLRAEQGIMLRYQVHIPYVPASGELFQNTASLETNQTLQKTLDSYVRFLTADGRAEGYVFTVQIKKVSEDGTALAGAEFELVRNSTGQVVGKLITDENGIASVNGLLKDNYTIREKKAPTGYELENKEISISPSDFGSITRVAFKTITNKRIVTSIQGKKTWDDNMNQDGLRPQSITIHLLANGQPTGQTTTATEATGWAYQFTNLPKYENGTEIHYSVKEEEVTGYTAIYDGLNITNKHEPEKTKIVFNKIWEDSNNLDGSRSNKITVILKADGQEVDRQEVTVDADGNWKGEFTNLDVYKQGVKINYTVDEVVPAGYEKTITGDSTTGFTIKNSHTPVTTTTTTTTTTEVTTTTESTTTTSTTTSEEPSTTTFEETTTVTTTSEEPSTTTSEETTTVTTTEEQTTTTSEESTTTTTTEEASTTTSTEETTTPPTPSSSTTTVEPKKVLPKTGQSSTIWLSFLGVLLFVACGFGYRFHRQKD